MRASDDSGGGAGVGGAGGAVGLDDAGLSSIYSRDM